MALFNFSAKGGSAAGGKKKEKVAEARLQPKEAELQRPDKPQVKKVVKDVSGVVLAPYTSEKGSQFQQKGEYVFKVFSSATKLTVKSAVSRMYGVQVKKVRIINVKPKKVRVGKFQGTKPGFKKAIVCLASGQKIDSLGA